MASKSELWKNITATEARVLAMNSGKMVNIDHLLARIHAASIDGRTEISVPTVNPAELIKLTDLGYSMKREGWENRSYVIVSW